MGSNAINNNNNNNNNTNNSDKNNDENLVSFKLVFFKNSY